MKVSGVSHYRGGTIEELMPLAKALKARYVKYGVGYRLSRVLDGPNEGDWLIVATYPDSAVYAQAQALFAQDAEMQNIFTAIAKFAKRTSREMVLDFEI